MKGLLLLAALPALALSDGERRLVLEQVKDRLGTARCVDGELRSVLEGLEFELIDVMGTSFAKYKEGKIQVNRRAMDRLEASLASVPSGVSARDFMASQYMPVIAHEAQHGLHERLLGCEFPCIEDEWVATVVELGCHQELTALVPDAMAAPTPLSEDTAAHVRTWAEQGPEAVRDRLRTGFGYSGKPSVHDADYIQKQNKSTEHRLKLFREARGDCDAEPAACAERVQRPPLKILGLRGREDLDREIRRNEALLQCTTPETLANARSFYNDMADWARELWCRQFPQRCGGAPVVPAEP